MIVRRFFDTKLAQISYLIGCGRTGTAIVIDPNRDVEQHVREAAADVRITHVTETHIQADFVSGARELAARAGATLYLSDEGDASWKYAYAAEARAVLLKGGDHVMVGDVRIDVVPVSRYPRENILQSGWLLGEEYLKDQANVVSFRIGKGYVVTYGSQIDFRTQPRATFKLLFDGLFHGPSTPVTAQQMERLAVTTTNDMP